MRVAFLTHNFPRFTGDAAGSFLLRLATALRADGVDVRVLAPAAPGWPATEEIEGVPVRRFRYAPAALETIAYTGTMASAVRGSWGARGALAGLLGASAVAARAAVRDWRADVVHAHWWFPSGLAAAPGGARRAAPLVVTMHGSDVRLAAGIAPARAAFRRVVRRAAAVTAVSRWLCAEAAGMAPGLACAVAPMPVATHLFAPADAPRAGLLFVGRLNAQKGLAHLLRAMARQRHPLPLTVVGDGPDAASLGALAASLGVADRVTWRTVVAQPELAAHYRAALALVVPSDHEGLGLVAVEAMLCETPVVAHRSGGLTDVVDDGRTGWLVPPGDPDALAAALDDVAEAGDRLAVMGRAGRAGALATFSPAAVSARYRGVYARVVAGSARGAGVREA